MVDRFMMASSLPMTENQLTSNQQVAIPSDATMQISFQNPSRRFELGYWCSK
jgi:hypothetical protein